MFCQLKKEYYFCIPFFGEKFKDFRFLGETVHRHNEAKPSKVTHNTPVFLNRNTIFELIFFCQDLDRYKFSFEKKDKQIYNEEFDPGSG